MLSQLKINLDRPLDTEQRQGQVEASLRRGLKSVPGYRRLDLIADGPSAGLFIPGRGTIACVNGALKKLLSRGIAPNIWLACDPQELVADFLPAVPPQYVDYWVGTACHEKVFERLCPDRTFLWHVVESDSPCPEGIMSALAVVSVTGCAISLFAKLGYNDIHVWGWDCALINGQDHAGENRLDHSKFRPINVGDPPVRQFTTSNAWAAEAVYATSLIRMLTPLGINVTVHGDGLLRATLDYKEPEPCESISSPASRLLLFWEWLSVLPALLTPRMRRLP